MFFAAWAEISGFTSREPLHEHERRGVHLFNGPEPFEIFVWFMLQLMHMFHAVILCDIVTFVCIILHVRPRCTVSKISQSLQLLPSDVDRMITSYMSITDMPMTCLM